MIRRHPLFAAVIFIFFAAPSRAAAPLPWNAAPQPFAFADFTWVNGNSRTRDLPLDPKALTGEFRSYTSYIFDFAHPSDHTLSGYRYLSVADQRLAVLREVQRPAGSCTISSPDPPARSCRPGRPICGGPRAGSTSRCWSSCEPPAAAG